MMWNDLLFLLLFFTAVVCLIVAAATRSGALLKRVGIGAAVYFAIVIGVSLVLPRREIKTGERQCFDDMCIAVERVESRTVGNKAEYDVTFALSSRARRVAQRENNLSVYVADANGRRYGAAPAAQDPFHVLLGPGQSAPAHREFQAPNDAPKPGLIVTHEGGFPIGWFIIGYDTWFRKPPVLWLRG